MYALVVLKLLVVPESKMAHLLMVYMSMLTVRRIVAVARAYAWVGVGRVCNKFLLLLATSTCQKLLYHS